MTISKRTEPGDQFFAAVSKMEPEALGLHMLPSLGEAAQCSIAISMKRIADALSGQGRNILTAPINQYGEGIGEAIQGQMERGSR